MAGELELATWVPARTSVLASTALVYVDLTLQTGKQIGDALKTLIILYATNQLGIGISLIKNNVLKKEE